MRVAPDIAIIGKMGAGKSTVADALINRHLYTRVSIAGKLKRVAVDIFGPGADKDRRILQGLGAYVRSLELDAWIGAAMREAESIGGPVVIDDCRHENEYTLLKDAGFVIIRVEAELDTRRERLKANGKYGGEAAFEDASETALDEAPADYTFINDEGVDVTQYAELLGTIIELEMSR